MIPGNHDDRAMLVRALPDHAYLPHDGGALAYCVDDFPVRLVGLDTLRDGYHDGELDDTRLAWLDRQLAAAPDTPTVVFMHHPAFATGIWWMDGNPLRGRAGFGADGECVAHPVVYGEAATQILDFANIVADYPAFAARLRSGEGLTTDGFGM